MGQKRSALQLRTYSVLPAEVVDGAHVRALHLFERSLILNQESGTGSSVPKTDKYPTLIKTQYQSYRWYFVNLSINYSFGVTQSLM